MTLLPVVDNLPLDEAISHIGGQPRIWVRAAAGLDHAGAWAVRLVELTSGAPPPSWTAHAWEYPHAVFAAFVMSGSQVAESLRKGTLDMAGRSVRLFSLSTSMRSERRQSHQVGIYETLEWPSTEVILGSPSGNPDPSGHMISASDAPSFVSYYAAAAFFFLAGRYPVGGAMNPTILYRHQDLRGRIETVTYVLSEDSLSVTLSGEHQELEGMTLELAGDLPGPRRTINGLDKTRTGYAEIRFPVPNGLPSGSWVVLRRGSEWIDRRFLSVPYTRGADAGVTIVVDPTDQLEALVGSRERQNVEFKQQLRKDEDFRRKLMKTVCAFANGQGGSILIGVTDDRELIGINGAAVDKTRDQLTQMVGSWVYPRPPIEFDILPIPDSENVVLQLLVRQSAELCGCGLPGETRVAYVRIAGVTERASPADITRIVRDRTASGQGLTTIPWLDGR